MIVTHSELISRKIEHMQKKLNDQSDGINALRALINEKNGEILEIQKHLQEKTALEDKKDTLEHQNQKLDQEIKVCFK